MPVRISIDPKVGQFLLGKATELFSLAVDGASEALLDHAEEKLEDLKERVGAAKCVVRRRKRRP